MKKDRWPTRAKLTLAVAIFAMVATAIAYALRYHSYEWGTPTDWANFGQYFGGIAGPIVTLASVVLLIDTLVANRTVAETAAADLAIRTTPYLKIHDLRAEPSFLGLQQKPAINMRLLLLNPGHVPVSYEVLRITEALTYPRYNATDFQTFGGIIFPVNEEYYSIGPKAARHPDQDLPAPEVRLRVAIRYSALESPKHTYITATLHGHIEQGTWRVRWTFVEGPTYSTTQPDLQWGA